MHDRLLIDTNLLLLMVIGSVDEGRHIKTSKRLDAFCLEDHRILWDFVGNYKEVLITPYIATEVSNLIDLDKDAGLKAFEILRRIFKEFTQPETSIVEDSDIPFFNKFGLTDSSIINLSKKVSIITNDHRLVPLLWGNGQCEIIPYFPVNSKK